MNREQLRARQLERLRATVARVLGAPLGGRLREAGIESPEDVGSLDDLARLPFTDKADLCATSRRRCSAARPRTR